MSRVLVMIPVKPNMDARLKANCRRLAERLPEANPRHTFRIVADGHGPGDRGMMTLAERARHIAGIRQTMVNQYLGDEDYVMWIDADIIAYAPTLVTTLIERNPSGVSAPMVLAAGSRRRFYDTSGFIENGRPARWSPPFFDQRGPVYDLDSVGCIYLMPAELFRSGGAYEDVPGFTEHYSICRHARRMGMPVRAYGDLSAYHADMGLFGGRQR